MSIETGPEYWSAHIRPKNKKLGITEADQKAAWQVIQKLGIAGKGCRHRYTSDIRFRTEEEAKAFWSQYTKTNELLDKMLEFNRGFDIYF